VIITSDGKEYVHSLKNFSKNMHTGDFLSSELLRVLNEIGVDKFSAIVSDHAANIVLAKRLIADKYPHIIPVRCIAHHINLLTNDIMKLNWSSKIIKDCKKVVKYFRKSHAAHEYLQEEIANFNIIGGSLKQYVKTRWTTAFDCTNSIIRCQMAIKHANICFFFI
jgi:hypothetical protein